MAATDPTIAMTPIQVGSIIAYRNTEGDTVVILRDQDLTTFTPSSFSSLMVWAVPPNQNQGPALLHSNS